MSAPSGPYIAQIYDASDPDVKTSAMQAATTWVDVYAQTTDPEVAGQPWNNGGYLVFSSGFISGKLQFTSSLYSQYIALLEDI